MLSDFLGYRQAGSWWYTSRLCIRLLLCASMDLTTAISIHSQSMVHETAIYNRAESPGPISLDPSQAWKGNDGPWSSFVIQVGTPFQKVDVDISIGGQETWVVVPDGCPSDFPSDDCGDLRGGIFYMNESSTWQSAGEIWDNNGIYQLGDYVAELLGINAMGRYGFDTVSLSYSGATTLNHTVVAGFADSQFHVGQFGVSPRPSNFTHQNGNSSSLTDPQPSFLSLLKENRQIPSLSYAFTAGSYSRSKNVKNALGSFIFGGYDSSLAGSSATTSFNFGPDVGRELIVGIQDITKRNDTTEASLLSSPIFAALDSSQANLWLPSSACELFEKEFGLEWNETTQLYLVNDSLHDTLVNENVNVTFRLGDGLSGTETIDIVFPYGAFDLTASYPLVDANTEKAYFPLKRAANDSQYTLGRTFFQEAYFVADYERNNFSLSQRLWSSTTQNIIPIRSVDDEADDTNRSEEASTPLSTGAIVGIVIGVVAFVAVVAILLFIHRRRKAKARKFEEKTHGEGSAATENNAAAVSGAELDGHLSMTNEMDNNNQLKPELLGDMEPRIEMDGGNQLKHEMLGDVEPRAEMDCGNQLKHELHGDVEHRAELDNPIKPAELAGDASDVQIHELAGDEPNLELAADKPNVESGRPQRP